MQYTDSASRVAELLSELAVQAAQMPGQHPTLSQNPPHPHAPAGDAQILAVTEDPDGFHGIQPAPISSPTFPQAQPSSDLSVLSALDPDGSLPRQPPPAPAPANASDNTTAVAVYEAIHREKAEALGPTHPDTAVAARSLAECLSSAGDPARALPLLERALDAQIDSLGGSHPETTATLLVLARVLVQLGHLAEATEVYRQVVAAHAAAQAGAPAGDRVAAQRGFGELLLRQGDAGGAASHLSAALQAAQLGLPPAHPEAAAAAEAVARCFLATGAPEEAPESLRGVLGDLEAVLGPGHPDTWTLTQVLADVHAAAGDVDAALALLRPLLQRQRRALGPGSPEAGETARRVGQLVGMPRRPDSPPSGPHAWRAPPRSGVPFVHDQLRECLERADGALSRPWWPQWPFWEVPDVGVSVSEISNWLRQEGVVHGPLLR